MQSIKALRKEKGFTQKALSDRTGIARSYICEIEMDRKQPSLKTLEKISKALSITADELLRREILSKSEYQTET